jgi:AAA+ superfamily predicted ATPase
MDIRGTQQLDKAWKAYRRIGEVLAPQYLQEQKRLRVAYVGILVVGICTIGLGNAGDTAHRVLWLVGLLGLIIWRIRCAVELRIQIARELLGRQGKEQAKLLGWLTAGIILLPMISFVAAMLLLDAARPFLSLPNLPPTLFQAGLLYTCLMLLWWCFVPAGRTASRHSALDIWQNSGWFGSLLAGVPINFDSDAATYAPRPAQFRPDPTPHHAEPTPTNRPQPVRMEQHLSWDDLILQEDTLQQIQTTLQVLTDPTKRRLIAFPPRGMLLYGPPGTGKTQIARVIASVGGFHFYSLGAAEARGEYIGHGPARIRAVFEEARTHRPAILFIDELDGIAPDRNSLGGQSAMFIDGVNELLQQMDGLDDRQVFVIGATNRPESLDPAILRRLGVDPTTLRWAIEIPLPDATCRLRLLKLFLKNVPVEPSLNLKKIVELTEGLSGDGLRTLCNQAGLQGVKKGHSRLGLQDFLAVMRANARQSA